MSIAPPPLRRSLLVHPGSPGGGLAAVADLSVSVARPRRDEIALSYRLQGQLESLRLPPPGPIARADELWRHTCFEAFFGQVGGGAYWEYNFSLSGEWAAYSFSGYRAGMTPLFGGAPPRMVTRTQGDAFELDVVLDVAWLARLSAPVSLRLGIAAVIEDAAGALSYWALAHPANRPDFHDTAGFVMALD